MPIDPSLSAGDSARGDRIGWPLLGEIALGAGVLVVCLAILQRGIRLPTGLALLPLPPGGGAHTAAGLAGPLLFAGAVFVALSLPARLRRVGTIGAVFVGFALALAELWVAGASTHDLVAGLLPVSDARDYVFEAGRLLDGRDLSPWGSRRPLASGYLAEMLWLSHGSLRAGVAILGLGSALSIALLVLQIRRRSGAASATTAFLVLFLFYRRFLGTPLSESGGFTFGALGLALLLVAFETRRLSFLGLGALCLTAGLTIRPGAFFMAPCLVLAVAWLWRRDWRRSLRAVALAGGFVAIGLGANTCLFKALGSSQGVMFANLAGTIYGTINGGDWELIYRQHPEIFRLPEGYAKHPELFEIPERKQTAAILRLVREDLSRDPSLAWKGAARAWLAFLLNRGGPFVYIRNWILEKLMMILGAIGIVFSLCTLRTRGESCLIVCGVLGIGLSLPFAPPWDSDSMRIYAVTVPFFALFGAAGVAFLCSAFGRMGWRQGSDKATTGALQEPHFGFPVLAASALAASLYLFPLYARFGPLHRGPADLRRLEDHAELTLALTPGNFFRVVSDSEARSHLPDIREGDFLAGLQEFVLTYGGEGAYLRQLAPSFPVLINPEGLTVGFIVARPDGANRLGLLHLRGRVYTLADNCAFFVEDGLPAPVDAEK